MYSSIRVLLAGLLSACLVACSPADPPDDDSDGGRPVIALVMKSLANEFFVTMADGARAHQAEQVDRYELIVNGIRNETDLAQQVALIDQMIAARVDAIVVAPADSKAMVPALARAAGAGIVVVNIDNRLDGDVLAEYGLAIPFVGPDNYAGAEAVGRFLAGRIDKGDEVAILEGVPTAFNSRQRTAGFRNAMEEAGAIIVAQQSAQWDQTAAVTVTAGILVQHPALSAILAANDNMALGAVAAIAQAGKTGQIAVVGFDNISAVRELIRSGRVLATADQHADLLAVYGIEYALEALASGAVPDDRATPVDLVTFNSLE
ncbi:MAG: sugar ABC transporter substrate-binding protein [Gammaproteobacteria bacterium]|nr:sugar ABC transporter substrate-binding protein [Gammaproteobacteria bacterium]MDH5344419.1 sugar ABC transporter substrate-binding protein [Gammaproteobacteria bacterium]